MAPIKPLGIDTVNMPEASGKIRVRGLNQEVIVLCEVEAPSIMNPPAILSLFVGLWR